MTCPGCGAHTQNSASFCTACGADLLPERRAHEPFPAGSCTPASTASGTTTEPIRGVRGPASPDGARAHPSPKRAARRPTPVKEMVGSERSEWIDRVWGSTPRVER
jgi:hypothetical protein